MHLRNLIPVPLQLLRQLRGVKAAVAPAGLDDLRLLLEREVGPLEGGAHDIAEEGQDLVVRDGARVGEVVDAGVAVVGEEDGGGEEVGEDGVRVGDVDDTVVLCDLGDEVAGVQVVGDGHAEAEDERVVVVLEDLHCRRVSLYVAPPSELGTKEGY